MADLMTLGDIANMFRCSESQIRQVHLKLPGFPDKAPTSSRKFPLWVRAEVRAFINREPIIRTVKPAIYRPLPQAVNLYRHFDKDGVLLYVGISTALMRRLSEHRTDAPWFWSIARIDVERHNTVKAAREAEKQAIVKERPLFNSDYSTVMTPVQE